MRLTSFLAFLKVVVFSKGIGKMQRIGVHGFLKAFILIDVEVIKPAKFGNINVF